jgi:phenylacetic acid degradation operon negative regulatory protein
MDHTEAELRPVSARSAILTILLGSEPPALTARELCATTTSVGYAESTARVAASRMAAAGDLVREGRTYTLSPRLLERHRRTERAVSPRFVEWDGDWEVVVITASGRSPAERAAQRAGLGELGLAELREGVWMRPANLERPESPSAALPGSLADVARRLVTRPVDDPVELAGELWDLPGWARRGRSLLELAASDDPPTRFVAVAAGVRHLLTDPLLPEALLPPGWPGAELRAVYADYRRALVTMRSSPDELVSERGG